MTAPVRDPVGTFCLVLHSHLPWLAHAGAWPVGEEWLHQAWAAAYAPVVELLGGLAEEGHRDVLTLGVTPVLAAQLDDPYCLAEHATWLGNWELRADGAADPVLRSYEGPLARAARRRFAATWAHGGSPPLRALADAGVVELLGGPATHPFTPLLHERVAAGQLAVGLGDAALRLGRRPAGIWLPECAYRPGLEEPLERAGVRRLVLDGPALGGRTGAAVTLGTSQVVAFPRDLEVTYRVWSPRAGYPGGREYRDFHTFDHDSGLRPARVTGRGVPPADKQRYDPAAAAVAVERDAHDFVRTVRDRLAGLGLGPRGLVVAAYDTELFGHWWHEGPQWLARVLRLLPAAGVRRTTLRGAAEAGCVAGPADIGETSWGAGKDWHIWTEPDDLVELGARLAARVLKVLDGRANGTARPLRDPAADQLVRELFLTTASDWAFMVSHDSAAGYARGRAVAHAGRAESLADALETGDEARAARLAAQARAVDGPFGALDARQLGGSTG